MSAKPPFPRWSGIGHSIYTSRTLGVVRPSPGPVSPEPAIPASSATVRRRSP